MTGGTFKWGLVGLGRIADSAIAPAISSLEGHELTAVVSRDQGRAEQFAARHGALHPLSSFDAMLGLDLDAVYIATPNALHAAQVEAAAAAGKHVLCDKPLATTVADAQAAVEACSQAGVKLGLMFQTRRFEGMSEAAKTVAAGQLGRVVVAEVTMSAGRNLPQGWRTDPAMAGLGTINNIGVHAFDLLRYLLGSEVSEVAAFADREGGLAIDTAATVLLRFANGCLGYVNANQAVPCSRDDLVVYGTEGRILGQNLTRPNRSGELRTTFADGREKVVPASTASGYRETVAAFAQSVREGADPTPGGIDGLRSVQLTEAIAEALEKGCGVPVRS